MVDELAVASILLAAVALISCLSVANKRAIRRLPRAAWVAAILLVPVGGAAAWFLFGRPLALPTERSRFWRLISGQRDGLSPVAPDDDTDFLRSLDRHTDGAQDDDGSGRPTGPA